MYFKVSIFGESAMIKVCLNNNHIFFMLYEDINVK